ncbi:Isopenicillin N synthase [Parafrankia irregularis]|uniref:Isopenicillin N synthase n=1 Tax=Parafrankia irregularis TaxID=795642 RepID=A0A0S4QL08_9ACTN|nr:MULTISPECIES: 2-oxoglutarate and iron-dependent oxygenase domain-containing protein [Parafrankia]MBE3201234.1 isopenicillin N synthase family oxygenase [Parafrankia sp. CH37]CUU56325.1 Isopenicillin N synthase [Parafrankia irregularis]
MRQAPGRPSGPSPRELPLLDLRRYTAPEHPADRAGFVLALRAACRVPGFFQLTGHGVPTSLTDRVLAVSRDFFRLPTATKLRIENVHSPHFRGYTRLGQEITRGNPDLREQIDIGDERPRRVCGPADPPYLRLDGPNQWPAHPAELRSVVEEYMAALAGVAQVLVRALAESLGLAPDHLDATFADDPRSHLKLLRYLPAPDGPAAETGHVAGVGDGDGDGDGERTDRHRRDTGGARSQGVGAHKDGGFLSLVLQDAVRRQDAPDAPETPVDPANAADRAWLPGLQVADGSGGWIDAPPVRGAFVVNIGEMFELATLRYYPATVHRVMSPPQGHERGSVAFFFGPGLSATIEPVPLPPALLAQIPDAGPPDPDNPIFAQHGENTLKSWLRSHPEVARRHYADLTRPDGAAR